MLLTIVNVAIIVMGIGFLIFIHELGHFLVAKKVGIRVEAFSLGFGPRIFGFERGDTVYKICAIPLGGYVKMSGEMPGEGTGDPDDFASKTITQRAWVVSAGVIMNVVVAFLIFPIAFNMGVPFDAPVIGSVAPGGPAWKADFRPGDRILAVNGSEILGFPDIRLEVAFASGPAEFKIERDGRTINRLVTPVYNEERGLNEIGITGRIQEVKFQEGAPALSLPAARTQGLEASQKIVSINAIPVRQFLARGYPEITSQFNASIDLEVRDDKGTSRVLKLPAHLVDPADNETLTPWLIGVTFCTTKVSDFLQTQHPKGAIFEAPDGTMGISRNDVITHVNDVAVHCRLEIDMAVMHASAGEPLSIRVVRGGSPTPVDLHIPGDQFNKAVADDFIHSLITTNDGLRVHVLPGSPAEKAGLQSGDRILAAGDLDLSEKGSSDLIDVVRGSDGREMRITVDRNGARELFSVVPAKARHNATLSSFHVTAERITSTVPFPRSIVAGSKQAINQTKNILLVLKSLVSGQVSAKNVGGPIMIFRASYALLEQGLAKFLFFLAILSLNLAILNILPIPILDGGHLVFLILEKVKGSPISERAMAYATYAGLFLMLSLMVFVTFNDIKRWLFT